MSGDHECELCKTVEEWFWAYCADVRGLTMTRFVFEKEMCGWSVQSTMGGRSFQMWNDRGEIWVKNDVTSKVWDYPALNLGEHIFTGEAKKVRFMLGLVQSDKFLSATIESPAPFYQKYVNNGPVI